MPDSIDWQARAVAAEVALENERKMALTAFRHIADWEAESAALALLVAELRGALAFDDAKASIEDQAAEYKRALAECINVCDAAITQAAVDFSRCLAWSLSYSSASLNNSNDPHRGAR